MNIEILCKASVTGRGRQGAGNQSPYLSHLHINGLALHGQVIPHQNLPSGKHTKNYGKSPCLLGQCTISMAIFNSYVKLPEVRGHEIINWQIMNISL